MTKVSFDGNTIINENITNIKNRMKETINEAFFNENFNVTKNITIEFTSENGLAVNGITDDRKQKIRDAIEYHEAAASDGCIESYLELAWLHLMVNNRESALIWFSKIANEEVEIEKENEIDYGLPQIQSQVSIVLIYGYENNNVSNLKEIIDEGIFICSIWKLLGLIYLEYSFKVGTYLTEVDKYLNLSRSRGYQFRDLLNNRRLSKTQISDLDCKPSVSY